jgi:hypothetical protein
MKDPDSMREIDATVRYLVLHIQNLERECSRLRNELAREKIVSYGAHLSCEDLRGQMDKAAKLIESVLSLDDALSTKTTRKLWNALDALDK